jgi:carbohydrate kinase (thermoresistant glucokinase family)
MFIVVIGPMGCGKSSLAAALADVLHLPFIEGDRFHTPAGMAKMAAGEPLTDEDRWPFLDAVADALRSHAPTGAVASCSALRRVYRDRLRARVVQPLRFVLPELSEQALEARVRRRKDHFMPPALLRSQLDTLEPPTPDEQAIVVDGALPTPAQVGLVLAAIAA